MKKLQFSKICKNFGAVVANDNISLSLGEGEILSLLGENGAGKTTLMNILFGHYISDKGFIEVEGKRLTPGSTKAALDAGIGMVHQHFTLAENLTVLENIILGTEPLSRLWSKKKLAYKKLEALSKRFGLLINPDAKVADLTVGEKQRVEIIKALYRDASILILDEPTAVLTPQETIQLFKVLKEMVNAGLSIMFISHKLNEILEISDRIVVLRHGKLVGEVVTKNASKESLAEMMVGRKVTRPTYEKLEIGKAVVELNNVCLKSSDGSVGLSNINLKIHEKEIIGLAGVAGNGQSGLASIFQGLAHPSSGEFKLFGESLIKYDPRYLTKSGVARIPEDRSKEGVIGEMELWENFLGEQLRSKAKSGFIIDKKQAVKSAEELIQKYDIRCEGAFASTRLLSGGNIQKLILARSLSNNPRFIIANKPARGLDEGAISFVQHQIINAKTKGAGVLLISEDLDEIFELSDRIAVIFDGKLQGPFDTSTLNITQVGLMMSGEMLEDSLNEA